MRMEDGPSGPSGTFDGPEGPSYGEVYVFDESIRERSV
jgi:hypothetical protein